MPDPVPAAKRQLVMGRAFGHCERCGHATLSGDPHHRRLRGMGGSKAPDRHDPAGLVWLCRPCHNWVHDNPRQATEAGFMIPRSPAQSPLAVPITDLAGQTRWLDNEGQYLAEPLEVPSV